MNTKTYLSETYLDKESTEKSNRPYWRSTITEFSEWEKAHKAMRERFSEYLTSKTISASFNHESAILEDFDGNMVILTITRKFNAEG